MTALQLMPFLAYSLAAILTSNSMPAFPCTCKERHHSNRDAVDIAAQRKIAQRRAMESLHPGRRHLPQHGRIEQRTLSLNKKQP